MKKKIQKPFDVEAAKNGAKVETRDGRSVRIICYDRKGDCPILALVSKDKIETCLPYTINGFLYTIAGLLRCSDDLVIVEEVEETKFKEGDWIIAYGEHLWLITTVTPNCYELQNTQGHKTLIHQLNIDDYSHLWTLNDAKPGDILVAGDSKCSFIFKGCVDKDHPEYPVAYCGINDIDKFIISTGQHWWTSKNVRPATYEERQQLFNKLEEEGYKWNAESLTLSKIPKRWRDDENAPINGYFIDSDSSIVSYSDWNNSINYNLFASEKQAKSALAMARISQIMANDERFGGIVTDDEWNERPWYNIIRVKKALIVRPRTTYEFLSFHTSKQADLFLEENKDLIRDYYMMD